MNKLNLEQITNLMELYTHNKEFQQFLVWHMVEQFDKIQEDDNFNIREDTLKNTLKVVLKNTHDLTEKKNLCEFFLKQEQFFTQTPRFYLNLYEECYKIPNLMH